MFFFGILKFFTNRKRQTHVFRSIELLMTVWLSRETFQRPHLLAGNRSFWLVIIKTLSEEEENNENKKIYNWTGECWTDLKAIWARKRGMIGRGECLKIKKEEGRKEEGGWRSGRLDHAGLQLRYESLFLVPFSLGFFPLSLLPPPLLLLVTDVVGDVSLIGLASSCMGWGKN